MAQLLRDVYLLQKDEYERLINPDVTYTLMTKTTAIKAVKNILKETGFTCWHDGETEDTCTECPVMTLLGNDAGKRMCTRQKLWAWERH